MDSCYPIFIWHDGTPHELGTVITAATVTVSADTSITLKINAAVDTRVGAMTSNVGDGVIVHTEHGTWGEIYRHINQANGWHCVLRDGHYDGLPDGMNALSETTCLNLAVGISTDDSDDFQTGVGIVNYEAGTSMEGVQACLYYFTGLLGSSNGSPLCQIFDCDDEAGTEQLIRQFVLTDDTEHAYPSTGPVGIPVYVAPPGHRILVLYEGVDNLDAGRANIIGGLRQIA